MGKSECEKDRMYIILISLGRFKKTIFENDPNILNRKFDHKFKILITDPRDKISNL